MDDNQTISEKVTNKDYAGGKVGFGFDEDTYKPLHVNVDDFYAKGTVEVQEPEKIAKGKANLLSALPSWAWVAIGAVAGIIITLLLVIVILLAVRRRPGEKA